MRADQHTHGDACLAWLAKEEVPCPARYHKVGTGKIGITETFGCICQGTGTVARFPMLREECICVVNIPESYMRWDGTACSFCTYKLAHSLECNTSGCNGLGWVVVEHDRLERVLAAAEAEGYDYYRIVVGSLWVRDYDGYGQTAAVALCRKVHDA